MVTGALIKARPREAARARVNRDIFIEADYCDEFDASVNRKLHLFLRKVRRRHGDAALH